MSNSLDYRAFKYIESFRWIMFKSDDVVYPGDTIFLMLGAWHL